MARPIGGSLGILLCGFLAFIAGCAGNGGRESLAPRPEVQAPAQVSDSFRIDKDPDGKLLLALRRASLEKEFLLQSDWLNQSVVPQPHALRSRIVYFTLRDGQLFLMQALPGHTVTLDLPQELILTTFPVRAADAGWVRFDFNAGMMQIFGGSDLAVDRADAEYRPEFKSAPVRYSYLREASLTPENQLAVTQVAQLDRTVIDLSASGDGASGESSADGPTMEVRYYLSPYHPDLHFKPVIAPRNERWYAFFVEPVQLTLGGEKVRWATHWNLAKPVVFAISANTPERFREAIRDGVLYWNRAFHANVVSVVDAPAGVVAPDFRYNVIQWVTWETASSAYTDAQTDPRTGEILHAQIFLPSSWAVGQMRSSRANLRRLQIPEAKKTGGAIAPRGLLSRFGASPSCEVDLTRTVAEMGVMDLKARGEGWARDPESVIRSAQDILRSVVAHEVGHALGLRHNFAGSLSPRNYAVETREQLAMAYLRNGELPADLQVSSTIMDYFSELEHLAMGRRIASGAPALEGDEKVLSILYRGKVFSRNDLPIFCTDEAVDTFVDCQRWDYGASSPAYVASEVEQEGRDLPYQLFDAYLDGVVPTHVSATYPLDEVAFSVKNVAGFFADTPDALVDSLKKDVGFLSVQHEFPSIAEFDEKAVKDAKLDYFTQSVAVAGGVTRVFPGLSTDDWRKLERRFDELLTDDSLGRGRSPSGQPYALSAQQAGMMKDGARKLFHSLPSKWADRDETTLAKIPDAVKVPGTELGDSLIKLFAARVEEYVLAPADEPPLEVTLTLPPKTEKADEKKDDAKDDGKTAKGKDGKPTPPKKSEPTVLKLALRGFAYSGDVRKKAPPLLTTSRDEFLSWGQAELKQIQEKAKAQILQGWGETPFKDVDASKIAVAPAGSRRKVISWIQENQAVLGALEKAVH